MAPDAVRYRMGLLQSHRARDRPWSVMFLHARHCGQDTFPSHRQLFILGCLLGGGSLYFAIALLISSLVEANYRSHRELRIALALLIVFDGDKTPLL